MKLYLYLGLAWLCRENIIQTTKKLKVKPLSAGLDKFDQKKVSFIPYNNIEDSKKILDKKKKDKLYNYRTSISFYACGTN